MATQVLAETNRAGCISVAFFPVGMVYGPGIHTTVNLSPAEARKLVEDIQHELARLGTAADLGEDAGIQLSACARGDDIGGVGPSGKSKAEQAVDVLIAEVLVASKRQALTGRLP